MTVAGRNSGGVSPSAMRRDSGERPWCLGGRLERVITLPTLWECHVACDLPDKGVTRIAGPELKTRLLALNRATAPWQVRDGAAEGVDLVAEAR